MTLNDHRDRLFRIHRTPNDREDAKDSAARLLERLNEIQRKCAPNLNGTSQRPAGKVWKDLASIDLGDFSKAAEACQKQTTEASLIGQKAHDLHTEVEQMLEEIAPGTRQRRIEAAVAKAIKG